MNPLAKNILAVVTGFVVGSLVNIGLVNIGPSVVPLPEGADVSTMENLRDSMKLFTPVNFVFPFLAHALGTLTGAFIAAKIAASHHSARIAQRSTTSLRRKPWSGGFIWNASPITDSMTQAIKDQRPPLPIC